MVRCSQLDVKDTAKETLKQQCKIPCELSRPGRDFNSREVKLDLTTLSSSVGRFLLAKQARRTLDLLGQILVTFSQ